jgi:hypothetical protein
MAISPHAIDTLHIGGFGTSGIQDELHELGEWLQPIISVRARDAIER